MEEKTEVEFKKARKLSVAKRNVTILVVVLCIAAAVYLNHSYNNQDNGSALPDASLVDAKNGEEAVSTGVNDNYISEYFAQARLTRQQSRDEALALLQAAATSDASQETIDASMNAIAAMATYSMQETQIENLLLGKGFDECVVYMSGERITIAVPAPEEGLAADQVAKITDAILSETDYTTTQIHVIEIKKPATPSETPAPEDTAESGLIDDIGTQGGYIEDGAEIYE